MSLNKSGLKKEKSFKIPESGLMVPMSNFMEWIDKNDAKWRELCYSLLSSATTIFPWGGNVGKIY